MSNLEDYRALDLYEPRRIIVHLEDNVPPERGLKLSLNIDGLAKLDAVSTARQLVSAVVNLLNNIEPNAEDDVPDHIRKIAELILDFPVIIPLPANKRIKTMNIISTHPTNIHYGFRDYCDTEEIHLAFNLDPENTVSVWNHGEGSFPELEEKKTDVSSEE